jgi:O-antigen/teichoic acid export membrane protein
MLWRLHHATAKQWVVAALLISSFGACVALVMVARSYGKPRFSPKFLRERSGEGAVFALSYSTTGIYNDADKALLGHFGMNAANGIYSMAYRIIDVACAPLYAVQAAAFPRFFKKGAEAGLRNTKSFALKILARTAPLSLAAAVAMFFLAPVIPRVVGHGFSDSVLALRWLCLIPLFRSFHISAGDALTGSGHQKLRLSTQAAAAVFNFAVNLYLIPRLGWLGAAWSSLATDGALGLMNWIVLLAFERQDRSVTAGVELAA